MAANILLCAYQDIDDWPESFVKVYVEDSLGDRMWVDSDACQSFVNNILTAFGTKRHPKGISRQSSDPGSKSTSQGELGTPTCNTVSGIVVYWIFMILQLQFNTGSFLKSILFVLSYLQMYMTVHLY